MKSNDPQGDLEKLKKDYEALKEKHNLPEFSRLSEDFGAERAAELETDYPLREIAKFMADKMINYLRFVEAMLNPQNVPMYVFSMIKAMKEEDKKKLSDMYKTLAKMEVKFMETDIESSEKKQAEFIKEGFEMWQAVKKELLGIVGGINKNWDVRHEEGRRDYFG
jgi:hypothetical protein